MWHICCPTSSRSISLSSSSNKGTRNPTRTRIWLKRRPTKKSPRNKILVNKDHPNRAKVALVSVNQRRTPPIKRIRRKTVRDRLQVFRKQSSILCLDNTEEEESKSTSRKTPQKGRAVGQKRKQGGGEKDKDTGMFQQSNDLSFTRMMVLSDGRGRRRRRQCRKRKWITEQKGKRHTRSQARSEDEGKSARNW